MRWPNEFELTRARRRAAQEIFNQDWQARLLAPAWRSVQMAAIVARSDAPQGGTKLVVSQQRGDLAVPGRATKVAVRQQLGKRAAAQIASSRGGETAREEGLDAPRGEA